MKHSALQFLMCLKCESSLELIVKEAEDVAGAYEPEIITGELVCKSCPQRYPVVRGIPRFVLSDLSSDQDILSGHKFGISWKEFSRYDEKYRNQFFDWLNPVAPSFLRNKTILECGCGKGRHTRIVAESMAKNVVAVDIGDAIEIAYAQVGKLPNVHFVQADIANMPLRQVFDFGYSVGVLHHMDSPEGGFKSLASKVKPDGSICVWVYGFENNWWIVNIVTPLRKAVTSKLPTYVLKTLTALLTVAVYLYSKLIARPWHALRKTNEWLPRVFYEDYLSYIAQFDFQEIHNIVFDHLVAPVAEYLKREEVESWFKKVGIAHPVMRWHNRNSWTGFGSYERSSVAVK